ncbi:MAG: glucosaminidase domain-containing protein [Oligoflexia bacterium]|nr:glucosaminidase domain-containing protein [Oligoflexia bacterium]
MVFFSILFFYSIVHADFVEVWDTSHTQRIIRAKKTIQTLKEQEECNNFQSLSSILNLFETLNEEEAIQAVIDPYKRKFLCEVDNYVSKQNLETKKDQKFMLDYLSNSDQVTEEDHIRMTELLIKYRLLRDENWKEYYVSATRFQPPEETKRQIRELAEDYTKQFGNPTHCFFVESDKVKKSKLEDKACRDEILLRVHPIPAPLVLTQSVLESGWGSSSLAKEESNILGLQVKFRNPGSMPNYPNCRPAKKDSSRCLLKFENYNGAVYEYFSRFNASHHPGYHRYRRARQSVYHDSDKTSCQKAIQLSKAIDFYAENPNYVIEIQSMINSEICKMISTVCLEESALTAKVKAYRVN